MKNFLVLGLLCLLPIMLSGCYDKKEIEEEAYVMAIGLDKAKEKEKIRVTFQISNPEVGTTQTGGSTNEPSRETVSLVANDFLTAKNTANSFVSKEISLDHARVLVVSEKLARSDEFINVIQGVVRSHELKRAIQVIVSKESAYKFLDKNKPPLETRPHKYYQSIIARARETGLIPDATVHRFFQLTEGDADLFLAIYATRERKEDAGIENEDEYIAGEVPQKGGNPTQFIGSAVFKEGKMIDTLDGEETRLAIILDNTIEIKDVLASYPDPLEPRYQISARVTRKKETKIDIQYHQDRPTKIDITVPINIEVLAVPSLVNYSNKKNQEKLKKAIEENLTKKTMELIEKTQEEYKAEPFYWSLYVRKFFYTIKDYEEGDWNKKIYPHADINVKYHVKITSFGKMIKDSNLSEVRD